MPIDINILRVERGGDPEKVRESQRRRFANVELVDEVLALDEQWRSMNFELNELKKRRNAVNKEIGSYRKKKEVEPEELRAEKKVRLAFFLDQASFFFFVFLFFLLFTFQCFLLPLFGSMQEVEERIGTLEVEVVEIKSELDSKVSQIGNIVDDSGFALFFSSFCFFFFFLTFFCRCSCRFSR